MKLITFSAEINVLAPLISNFYLASYALINFCTFHAALVRPLGWRPTFKVRTIQCLINHHSDKLNTVITCSNCRRFVMFQYYNKWLSLFAFVLCIAIMFLINWVTSIVTFIVFFVLYLVVVYRNPSKYLLNNSTLIRSN